jgi:uncharacterized membrane protein YeaQ/YmgE (transglycosylase-associated protein family)
MSIVWTILIGFTVGSLAKYIMPGKENAGFLLTTVLGIGGAFVGSFLFGLIGISTGGLIMHLASATVGALGILWAYNKMNA